MNPRPILIALGCATAIVVGTYLFGRHYFNLSREDTTPIVTTDKTSPTDKGHQPSNVRHTEPQPSQPTNAATNAANETNSSNTQTVPPITKEEYNRLVENNLINWDAYKASYRAEHGIDPPPPNANWRHVWGPDGSVHKLYDGEAAITEYKMVRAFAPTKEQYERYEQLYAELESLKTRGPYAAQLSDEIDQIIAESQGEVPLSFSAVYLGNEGETGATHEESSRQAQIRALQRLFRQFDLEHLVPYYFGE